MRQRDDEILGSQRGRGTSAEDGGEREEAAVNRGEACGNSEKRMKERLEKGVVERVCERLREGKQQVAGEEKTRFLLC